MQQNLDEMIQLVPTVISILEQPGIENVILKFLKSASDNKFPLDNVAFLLWVELVRFYNLDNTCKMRYSESTKKLWKLGWMLTLFGSKFIRFMVGCKNTSQVAFGITKRGAFITQETQI